ncbi:MAG: hypothetical protein H7039_01820 [Bryobacteraceae bacterium]|nr:hypothetical protein [Bryobacteraceae bacterium]
MRAVTVRTGTGTVTLASGFTVTGSQTNITLSSATNPMVASAGTTISVTALNVPSGPIAAAQVTGTIQPVIAGTGLTVSVPATSVMPAGAAGQRFSFKLPELNVTASVQYQLAVAGTTGTGNIFRSQNRATFSLVPAAAISLDPVGRTAGQIGTVLITGRFSNFIPGVTQASFGAGISVNGAAPGVPGPVTVTTPTTATAQIRISPLAEVGARTVTVITNAERATLVNGFSVLAGNPSLFSLEPSSARLGETLTATLTGQFTNFLQGSTQVELGAGITVTSVSVKSKTSLTLQLAVAANTNIGGRIVVVATGSERAELVSGFTVGATPTVTVLNPDSFEQGQSVLALVNVEGINYLPDSTQFNYGPGIAVGGFPAGTFGPASVLNGRSATALVVVGETAAPGKRAVQVKIGSTILTKADAFTVVAKSAPPLITLASPTPLTLFTASSVSVTGRVDDPQSTVTVNGVTGTVSGSTFSATVPLIEGVNLITATARSRAGVVGTASVSVTRDTTPPTVFIDAPSDGATLLESTVMVTGLINDIVSGTVNQGQASVTVNGVAAQISNRSFSVPELLLVKGANVLEAVARDRAGNESRRRIKVTVGDSASQQKIQIVSGNNQSAIIGEPLGEPLTVVVLEANGNPLPDQTVTFAVRRGEGTLLPLNGIAARSVAVKTDDKGLARIGFGVGMRVGVGNNQIAVTSPGFSGEVLFCASATHGPAVMISQVGGDGQRGIVGRPLPRPLVTILSDAGGNAVPGAPILFLIREGAGTFENGLNVITKNTDQDGKVSAILTLGPNVGSNTNVVNAQFREMDWQNLVTFFASSVLPGETQSTRVSGLVLDNGKRAIPRATAKIVGTTLSAVTDAQGRFTITGAPVGTIALIVDGSTSTRPEVFPFLAYHMVTLVGQDNSPMTGAIELPPLDTENSRIVGGDTDVVLTMKGLPGYRFTVFARSATFPDGSKTGRLSLSQVASDKVPMPPPNGAAPRVFGTLQPANVAFNPPIRVEFPNTEGLAPGTVIEVTSFDHDLEQFVTVGTARVSLNGSIIVSDPGFGIPKSGWHGPIAPPPPQGCVSNCACVDGVCI